MIIKVSNNFIQSIRKLRKEWNENLSDNDIFVKITKALISDKILFDSDKIKCQITNEEKFQGVIIPKKKQIIHFCQMCNKKHKIRSRNTFLSQNVITTYFIAIEKNYSLSVSINPYDIENKFHFPNFIKNTIRELLTIGININNSLNKYEKFYKFKNIDEYLINRKKLRSNIHNQSTLIVQIANNITVYGKLDGANKNDTLLICKVISKLSSNFFKLNFYDITSNLSKEKNHLIKIVNKIKDMCFQINDVNDNENELIARINKNNEKIKFLQRDQETFKANIIKKYLTYGIDIHKCIACDYNIESNFIAAHIYRYCDIIQDFKNNKINAQEAAHFIVSGDNGFLLCPNQDKEFEKGQIYFDLKTKKFVANHKKLNEFDFECIKAKIKCLDFNNLNFSQEFIENNKKHHKRIGL